MSDEQLKRETDALLSELRRQFFGEDTMLVKATLTVKLDLKGTDLDDALQAALKQSGEELYAVLAILSNYPPTITAEIEDEDHGTRDIDMFFTHKEDYSE